MADAPELRQAAIERALDSGALKQVRRTLHSLHPAEIALLLEAVPPGKRELVWELVDPEDDGEVLLHVNEELRRRLIRGMEPEELVAATADLELDDLADLITELPETVTQRILRAMDQQDRQRLETVLSYSDDSAGGLMNPHTVTVRPDVTLEVVFRYLRLRGVLPSHTDALVVVDRYDRYLGQLPLATLLANDPERQVAEVMDRDAEPLPVTLSAGEVAKLFANRDLVSAPVVDEARRLVGRVTVDDVVDVMREEAQQSLMGMAGVSVEEDMFAPTWQKARHRWPWLGINLVTAFIASRVIGAFEDTIVQLVALAALLPIVAAVAGNTGNQTIALIVRAVAVGQLTGANMLRLLRKELMVSVVNGLIWGAVVAGFAYVFYGRATLSVVIGAAMMANIVLAATIGVLIPMALRRLGRDPAVGSSVMLTAATDSIGFFIFLGLATVFLL